MLAQCLLSCPSRGASVSAAWFIHTKYAAATWVGQAGFSIAKCYLSRRVGTVPAQEALIGAGGTAEGWKLSILQEYIGRGSSIRRQHAKEFADCLQTFAVANAHFGCMPFIFTGA